MENSYQPQGYAYEFVPPFDSKYECPICLVCLKDTVKTSCGHKFCQECILKWLRTEKKCCPTDNSDLTEQDISPDIQVRQEIMKLTVKCPQAKNGCNVIAELGHIQKHESSCEYAVVQCPEGCNVELYRKDIKSHMTCCEYRQAQACCKELPDIEKSVLCEFCNVFMDAADKEKHIQFDCQRAIVSCQFAQLGCPYPQVERQHLLKHQEKCVSLHVNLLQKAFTKLVKEDLRHSENQAEAKHPRAVACSSSGKQANQGEGAWAAALSNYNDISLALYKKNIELQNENRGLLNAIKTLQKKMTFLEDKMAVVGEKISQGIYYWRMPNFSAHEEETFRVGFKELKSPGFYTGTHGYRVSLRTTLESKGNGKYSLSLFMHLMQSENDDFLIWPFSGRIELSILDQQVNEEYRRPILETMCSNPQLAAFQRPTKECNSKGFGYKEFANSDLLHDHKRKYLKNDTLIIRAEVVPTMFL